MSKIILKFEKPGCGPCKTVDTILEREGINVTKVNLVNNPEMFQEYGIKSVPTILVLDESNEVINTIIGPVEHAIINLKTI